MNPTARLLMLLSGGASTPASPIPTTNLAAWWRKGTGITDTAGAVSLWADQSGNGVNLAQATGANQPALQGDGTILFDETLTKSMKVAFTLAQPLTLYIRIKQVSWVSSARICDGNTNLTMAVLQTGTTPNVNVFAGAGNALDNTGLTVGQWKTFSLVLNGASSSSKVSGSAKVTGDPGSSSPSGFTLGSRATGDFNSNIQVAGIAIYSVAHDDTVRGTLETWFDTQ
jgi:hypothetical protein